MSEAPRWHRWPKERPAKMGEYVVILRGEAGVRELALWVLTPGLDPHWDGFSDEEIVAWLQIPEYE